MKKAVLLFLFLLFAAYNSYACSCNDLKIFCNSITTGNFPKNGIIIQAVKLRDSMYYDNLNRRQPYMEVKALSTLYGTNSKDTITLLLDNGGQCYEPRIFFNNNDTFIFAIQGNRDTTGLSDCGRYFLNYSKGKVSGYIMAFSNSSMDYDSFLTFLQKPHCIISGLIEDEEEIISINISPNPSSSGVFNLSFNYAVKRLEVSVYNSCGQFIMPDNLQTEGKKAIILNLSSQPKGLYFIKATDGNKTMTAKVLKE